MDSFALEASAHRIGGREGLERAFQTRVEQINANGVHYLELRGLTRPQDFIRLILGPWRLVRAGLLSTDMRVEDMSGINIGGMPRPVLLVDLPCDVPLYSNHIAADPDYGVISVGLRTPRTRWMPGDLETVKAAEAAA